MKSKSVGKKVIVRGDRSGVFYGVLAERQGQEVELINCRRLWYWDGAASISELAKSGTKEPLNCKFTVTVESIELTDCIEVIPCTEEAIRSIEAVPEWTA